MRDLKKIREMHCDTMDGIVNLIHKSFPPALGYAAEYFIGEDEEIGKQFLCFLVRTEVFGNIYQKRVELNPSKFIDQYEEEFVGAVIRDFFILGTAFLTNDNIRRKGMDQMGGNIIKNVSHNPFKEGILNGKINMN